MSIESTYKFFRYLSLIDVSYGFDKKFFEMFKLTLEKREDKQKHGVILLDEIHLRESINVNSKRLTYTGLVDFGIDGPQSTNLDERADHSLVIMFQSIADCYSQPIGIFASRGPVSGETTAQLVSMFHVFNAIRFISMKSKLYRIALANLYLFITGHHIIRKYRCQSTWRNY